MNNQKFVVKFYLDSETKAFLLPSLSIRFDASNGEGIEFTNKQCKTDVSINMKRTRQINESQRDCIIKFVFLSNYITRCLGISSYLIRWTMPRNRYVDSPYLHLFHAWTTDIVIQASRNFAYWKIFAILVLMLYGINNSTFMKQAHVHKEWNADSVIHTKLSSFNKHRIVKLYYAFSRLLLPHKSYYALLYYSLVARYKGRR